MSDNHTDRILQKWYTNLRQMRVTKNLLEALCGKQVIDDDDKGNILKTEAGHDRPELAKADALLELVKGRGSTSFYAFRDALGESTIKHNRSLADLLTAQAEECVPRGASMPQPPSTLTLGSACRIPQGRCSDGHPQPGTSIKEAIEAHRDIICSELNVSGDLLSHLLQDKVFGEEQKQHILYHEAGHTRKPEDQVSEYKSCV
ncbi:uncharacterized protein LOC135829328 [Sycon ciliatum]|uniref:uncharacterized protein LOC135829328 n=1 Tax=Sycon ciliatum TaxID=27933 RepID=UPI0031F5FBC9